MKMEHAAIVDRHDLGAGLLQHPREAATRHAIDVNRHGGGCARTRAHRLALLAEQRLGRRQRHLVCRADARRDVVDLHKVDRGRLIREGGRPERAQRDRAHRAGQDAGEPHAASSSARRRGTDVLEGLTPTLSA